MPVSLLPLAIAAAVYPTLLAIVVVILTRPRPVRLLSAFLAGGVVMATTVGLIGVFALEGTGALKGSSGRTVSPVVDLVGGLLAIGLSLALSARLDDRVRARRRRAARSAEAGAGKDPWSKRMLERDSIVVAFALGLVMNVPSAWYLIALKDIAASGYPAAVDVMLVLGFEVVMFTLLEIPLVLYLVAPERTERLVHGGTGWLRAHGRRIGAMVAAGIGVFLILRGLVELP